MGSPAAARGREVRRRLLDAAAELVPERGWSAVSTRVLADRAGVTPSVVHYHFSSVQALLTEAVLEAMRSVVGAEQPILVDSHAPVDVVDAMLASVDQFTGADPMSLLFVEAYLAATRDEELRAGIAWIMIEFRTRLARSFADHGVADAEACAAVLMAAIDGLLLQRALNPDTEPTSVAKVLRRLVT